MNGFWTIWKNDFKYKQSHPCQIHLLCEKNPNQSNFIIKIMFRTNRLFYSIYTKFSYVHIGTWNKLKSGNRLGNIIFLVTTRVHWIRMNLSIVCDSLQSDCIAVYFIIYEKKSLQTSNIKWLAPPSIDWELLSWCTWALHTINKTRRLTLHTYRTVRSVYALSLCTINSMKTEENGIHIRDSQ